MLNRRKHESELVPVEQTKRVIKVDDGRRRGARRRGARKIGGVRLAGYAFSVLLVLLVVSAAAAFILFQANLSKIQKMADSAIPELRATEDGTYELSWQCLEEAGADYYFVDVSTNPLFSEGEKRTFFSGYVEGVSCSLPELPTTEGLVLQIELVKKYTVFGKERALKQASIERNIYIQDPAIRNLDWVVDSDEGTAIINIGFQGSNSCSVYVTEPNGEKRFLRIVDENSLEDNRLVLNLEEEGLWIPTTGNPCVLTFMPGNRVNGMAVYAGASKDISFTWEDFAARDIHLGLEVMEGGICRLEWERVDCDSYEIQMMNKDLGTWELVKTVTGTDECTYVSQRLSPGKGYSFRIAAVMNDYMAVSEVRECEIPVTPLYCTVWPVKNLKAYSDAAQSEVVGEVKQLDAHCVIAVENDRTGKAMFGVNIDGRIGYIDSNFCMINLPEYVGGLCSYDITNSYYSIFMAHGFEIPGLTGEIIKGFEDVRLKDNSFLVPLLYPTALKLETAIANARDKGYRLKIYEAFRPHDASVYMYRKASEIQYATLPEETYWGEDPGVYLYIDDVDENGAKIKRRKTYWELMNDSNNSFNLSAFVSAGISKHNLGVAMDLTIESLDSGNEMPMQTDLHDLSQFSARVQNNEYAKELSRIMLSANFGDLYSEWWHFQDNEIRTKIDLPCVNEGVTPECWMYNGYGWRYRGLDGTFAAGCTLTVDGTEYTFDSNGYVLN